MSVPAPPSPPANPMNPVNGRNGLIKTAGQLLGSLPSSFLMLVLINVIFIGFIVWFLDDQMKQHNEMFDKLFDKCMSVVGSK